MFDFICLCILVVCVIIVVGFFVINIYFNYFVVNKYNSSVIDNILKVVIVSYGVGIVDWVVMKI